MKKIAGITRILPALIPVAFALGMTALAALTAVPTHAWDYRTCLGDRLEWGSNSVAFYPSTISFQPGAGRPALDAVLDAWNNHAPGTNFRFSFIYDSATTLSSGDGKNSVAYTSSYDWGTALAVTLTRNSCSHITEADVIFNPAPSNSGTWTFDTHPATPPSPWSPYNMTLVGIHEFGHAFGLDHQSGYLATMNDHYPGGGTLGLYNDIYPHADDVLGSRVGYGTCCTHRDVYASTYRSTSSIDSDRIIAPSTAYRGQTTSFQFTIGNRGTTQESSVRVHFYLSPSRYVTPYDTYLGAATYSMNSGSIGTYWAYVTIPTWVSPGSYYLSWIVDPYGFIPEVDEGNNSNALFYSTYIPDQSPPVACFSASPTQAFSPANVSVDASCSSDPDGNISSYQWDFGNGNYGFGVTSSYYYTTPGSYNIALTVTDSTGLSSTTYQSVWIQDPNCPNCV